MLIDRIRVIICIRPLNRDTKTNKQTGNDSYCPFLHTHTIEEEKMKVVGQTVQV